MNADDLAKILDELGQRLGPTGEHVFQLAVRQVYIDATIQIVFGGIALVLLTAIAGIGTRLLLAWYRASQDITDAAFGVCLGLIVLGLPATFAAGAVATAAAKLLNPEYAALRDILGAIR